MFISRLMKVHMRTDTDTCMYIGSHMNKWRYANHTNRTIDRVDRTIGLIKSNRRLSDRIRKDRIQTASNHCVHMRVSMTHRVGANMTCISP